MGEKFKKNVITIIMTLITTVMSGIVLLTIGSVVTELKNKATKTEVNEKFIQHELIEDQKFQVLNVKVETNKESIEETKELYLYEIRELRKDWKEYIKQKTN